MFHVRSHTYLHTVSQYSHTYLHTYFTRELQGRRNHTKCYIQIHTIVTYRYMTLHETNTRVKGGSSRRSRQTGLLKYIRNSSGNKRGLVRRSESLVRKKAAERLRPEKKKKTIRKFNLCLEGSNFCISKKNKNNTTKIKK